MPVAIVTGSGGLIGSESVAYLVGQGYDVVGLENDMRARFFGPEASTASSTRRLSERFPDMGLFIGAGSSYRRLSAQDATVRARSVNTCASVFPVRFNT